MERALWYNQVLGEIAQQQLITDERFPEGRWYIGPATITSYEFEALRVLDRLLFPSFLQKVKESLQAQGIRLLRLKVYSAVSGLKVSYTIEVTTAGIPEEVGFPIAIVAAAIAASIVSIFGYLTAGKLESLTKKFVEEVPEKTKETFFVGTWLIAAGIVAFLLIREVKRPKEVKK